MLGFFTIKGCGGAALGVGLGGIGFDGPSFQRHDGTSVDDRDGGGGGSDGKQFNVLLGTQRKGVGR